MRLLLVEDEKELARALVTVLTYNHYSVDEVYDGEQAVVYLENGNYDGVILDIMLPDVDGFQILKQIREKYTGESGSCIDPVGKIGTGG